MNLCKGNRRWPAIIGLLGLLFGVSAAQASTGPADLARVKPAVACTSLINTDLVDIGGKGSRVTAAVDTTNDGVPVCAVSGTLAPAIEFRVLLPRETWTQRYMQLGCGGLCGRISMRSGASDGCQVLANGGFVLGSTNMGHDGNGGEFGLDPQKRADFAYRAQHLTADTAKRLIRAYYGQSPEYAYFNGCSDGGREALVEAQRYPDDFDGIIAGAPAMNFQVQNTLYHGWQATVNRDDDGNAILLADRLPVLHRAVVAACDDLDGLSDGLISAPLQCDFDPASVVCPDDVTDTRDCLTPAEARVASQFYQGPVDADTGTHLTAGQPLYGSELAWAGVYVPTSADGQVMSRMAALPALRYLAFDESPGEAFTLDDLRFDLATFNRLRARHPLYDATNPDLSAFAGQGGKLILWHGLADPHISPLNTIAYHQAVQSQMGEGQAEAFERLYLLPGVYHCGQGEGPSQVDLLTPMMEWVENGQAPDAIVTRQSASEQASDFGQPHMGEGKAGKGSRPGKPPGAGRDGHGPMADGPPPMLTSSADVPERSRPIYPYPDVAAYSGEGDENDAASFERGDALNAVPMPDWAGSDFYMPYEPRER
ncbi:tannase/feruloyl esterase family alpha/beta hydrolase [Marinobacter sp. JSM 1782161]|uniref:tannase/feruloyl esterase family alpha/beta hydrolase n=1 Tax=Marinobacter sp. JSM 1782161 TaxID=2685906 RepID=UPI001A9ED382|nr:tannase/feruloyl esterase family alpha/beta hydrolase [Marinobacter sp. JSM 1782161]